MTTGTLEPKQHAHELIEQLAPGQLTAVVQLLEGMVHDDDDNLTEEDEQAVAASREYFKQGGKGLSLEQLAAECGFTMDEIRKG
jgi:hypothetical protein